jgi:phosphopantothenoylcysteine decarboxylase/phosphopantothenate--cysteine ligase
MGYAVAQAARSLGAEVVLVSGPTEIGRPEGVEIVDVVDAEDLRAEMVRRATDADIVVMSAAVSDYRPRQRADEKLKKLGDKGLTLQMERTPDILAEIVGLPGRRTVVGFAAETSELEARAREKMERKGCDLMVANLVGAPASGFAADTNEVVILDRLGGRSLAGPASKRAIAASILDAVIDFRRRAGGERSGKAG